MKSNLLFETQNNKCRLNEHKLKSKEKEKNQNKIVAIIFKIPACVRKYILFR